MFDKQPKIVHETQFLLAVSNCGFGDIENYFYEIAYFLYKWDYLGDQGLLSMHLDWNFNKIVFVLQINDHSSREAFSGTWKRKIKPFLTAGAGIVQYKPYVYYYVTDGGLDENPAYAKVAPVFNAGAGLYYFEGYVPDEIEDKLDFFAVFGLRIIWSLSAS